MKLKGQGPLELGCLDPALAPEESGDVLPWGSVLPQ